MGSVGASRFFSIWAYPLAGISSAVVLFLAAQASAVFFAGTSSPMAALGSTVIDFTPGWLKDAVIGLFGTNDKLFLFVILSLVIAVLTVLIGVMARRSFTVAAFLVVLCAVVLGACVLSRADTEVKDLGPTILGTVCGLAVLKWLTNTAGWAIDEENGPEEHRGVPRRRFLFGAAGSIALGLMATGANQALRTARTAVESARAALHLPPAKARVPALPPGADLNTPGVAKFITPNEDFYRIDTALAVPRVDPRDWTLRIHGMVENEFTLTFEQLLHKDLVEHYLTLTCVSNPVGGDLVGNAKWLGYPLREVLKQATPTAGADMVLSTSIDGFSASTPLEALTDGREALLAIGMNGEPLPLAHGFPVRLVVPGLYGYVSATKWVVDLEVTRFQDKVAYWTTRGWAKRGPIKMSSRIDTPRSFAKLPAGRIVFGGAAWAQTEGISKVEVRIDDGPWQDAELSAEVSMDTWRQWRYVWAEATPGNHAVTVRAANARGELQTELVAAPAPDGSSGWHRVQFSVT